jgi:hypothetical protein
MLNFRSQLHKAKERWPLSKYLITEARRFLFFFVNLQLNFLIQKGNLLLKLICYKQTSADTVALRRIHGRVAISWALPTGSASTSYSSMDAHQPLSIRCEPLGSRAYPLFLTEYLVRFCRCPVQLKKYNIYVNHKILNESPYSSVVERQSCKLKVRSSILRGGIFIPFSSSSQDLPCHAQLFSVYIFLRGLLSLY